MTQAVELLASYWTISAGLPHTDREYSPFDFKDRVQSAAIAGSRALASGMPTSNMFSKSTA